MKTLIPPKTRNCRNQTPKIRILTEGKNGYGKKTTSPVTPVTPVVKRRFSNKNKCPSCKTKLEICTMYWSDGWETYFGKLVWKKIKDDHWEVYLCNKCGTVYDKGDFK